MTKKTRCRRCNLRVISEVEESALRKLAKVRLERANSLRRVRCECPPLSSFTKGRNHDNRTETKVVR
jgi:hypothetical protein